MRFHGSDSLVADGVFRAMLPMCFDLDGHPPRDQQLAVADLYVCLHDGAGLLWGFGGLSGWQLDQLTLW